MINANKVERVNAKNVIDVIDEYHDKKSIIDEAKDLIVDSNWFDDDEILLEIERQSEIGSRSGIVTETYTGEGGSSGSELDTGDDSGNGNGNVPSTTGNSGTVIQDEMQRLKRLILEKKAKSYELKILFFAYLTESNVNTLQQVVESLEDANNTRIAHNLGLSKDILKKMAANTGQDSLDSINEAIGRKNRLSNAATALENFKKLGDAIIVTPSKTCKDMVDHIPDEVFKDLPEHGGKILDIAGVAGEFALAVQERMQQLGLPDEFINDAIYTVPKNSLCYELIRKTYKMHGMNQQNIATDFYANDLSKYRKGNEIDYDKICDMLRNKLFTETNRSNTHELKFDVVIGNPPYQGKNHAQIYTLYYKLAIKLSHNCVSLIFPVGWQLPKTANKLGILNKKEIKADRQIVSINNVENVFPSIPGAKEVNIVLWRKGYDNGLFCMENSKFIQTDVIQK